MNFNIPSFDAIYWGNSIQKWALAISILLVTAVAAKMVRWILRKAAVLAAKTETELDDLFVTVVSEPLSLILCVIGFRVAASTLTLPEGVELFVGKTTHVFSALLIGWMLVRFCDELIAKYIQPLVEKSESDLDDQLLPVVRKGIKIAIWSLSFIIGMNNAGYDVAAIIAGLGLGGLAFALAAKDTISNLFGGFTVYTDRPFRLNDRIRVKGFDGVVKEIGLRSTRIQTAEGRHVTMPNATFADQPVENISSEPSRLIRMKIGLSYEMNHLQVKAALDTLREVVNAEELTEKNCKASFVGFSEASLDLEMSYNICKTANAGEIQTKINLNILKKFEQQGIAFSRTTRILHPALLDKCS